MGTFGDPTAAASTTPSTTAASTSNGSADASSATTTQNDDASGGPTSGDDTEATSSDGTTFFTGSGSGTFTGGVTEQPEEGMYSPCESALECFGLTFCRTVAGEEGLVGFCTNTGCAGPSDCEAAPAGDATPGCFPADVNGEPGMVCALTCEGGATCPSPMICHDTANGSVCA